MATSSKNGSESSTTRTTIEQLQKELTRRKIQKQLKWEKEKKRDLQNQKERETQKEIPGRASVFQHEKNPPTNPKQDQSFQQGINRRILVSRQSK